MRTYCAIAKHGDITYKVMTIGPYGDFHHTATREFETWDEAVQVAKDLASGKYPYIGPPGAYVNMR